LVFLMAAAGLYAQQAGQFTVGGRFGGALGFNDSANFGNRIRAEFFNDWTQEPSVLRDPELNIAFALYGNYAITDRLSVQPELNFMIGQGYELRFSARGYVSREVDVNYNSLDIPILVRFNVSSSPLIFGIQAGPHISIPLGTAEIYQDNAGYLGKFTINSSAVFGFTAGLFSGFPAGPGRIVGDLRFVFDFNTVELDWWGDNAAFMNRRALAFTVGYELSF